MDREFYWRIKDKDCVILYGPEKHMLVAVATLEAGDEKFEDGCWRIISPTYLGLNVDEDGRLSLEHVKRKILVLLGNELTKIQN